MAIDAAVIGIVVTVLFALMALAYRSGSLSKDVEQNKSNIRTLFDKFSDYQKENKSDHREIMLKIDRLNNQKAN